jgi:hypothetical protein
VILKEVKGMKLLEEEKGEEEVVAVKSPTEANL